MRRTRRVVLALVASLLLAVGLLAPSASAGKKPPPKPHTPSKVVIIVVDALSREIVQKYDMRNVKALMRDGSRRPNGYLGHLGAVTVVTHNVVTTGALPKNMGWTDEGYRDVDGVLADQKDPAVDGNDMWLTSNFGSDQMSRCRSTPATRSSPTTCTPSGPGRRSSRSARRRTPPGGSPGRSTDRMVTFSGARSTATATRRTTPTGVARTASTSRPTSQHRSVAASTSTPTPARSTTRASRPHGSTRSTEPLHGRQGPGRTRAATSWAADAAIATMKNEPKWSGVFVTLPGVDKAAHMWGGIDDPGGTEPMTHMKASTKVADQQVGKIMSYLRTSGQLKDTLVVLTSDHGSVPGRNFHGVDADGQGYYNWYYGTMENDEYLDPQPALKPLVDTGNLAMTYSDSMVRAWLKNQSAAKVQQAVGMMAKMPDVSAVWKRRRAATSTVASPVRWDRMPSKGERDWFKAHAQELLEHHRREARRRRDRHAGRRHDVLRRR